MNIEELNLPNTYDLIIGDAVIHDLGYPKVALRSIVRSLKDKGVFFMVENAASSHLENNLNNPFASMLYTLSCMHCVPVSLAQDDGEGLGSMWGKEKILQYLVEVGFINIEVKPMTQNESAQVFISRVEN